MVEVDPCNVSTHSIFDMSHNLTVRSYDDVASTAPRNIHPFLLILFISKQQQFRDTPTTHDYTLRLKEVPPQINGQQQPQNTHNTTNTTSHRHTHTPTRPASTDAWTLMENATGSKHTQIHRNIHTHTHTGSQTQIHTHTQTKLHKNQKKHT